MVPLQSATYETCAGGETPMTFKTGGLHESHPAAHLAAPIGRWWLMLSDLLAAHRQEFQVY